MAFDGITINHLVKEFREKLLNGRMNKIAQPEKDALLLTIKGSDRKNHKLLLSAQPSLPLAYFTEENKQNPMVAPNFCMLLRKHISSGKIIDIYQPDFERIIVFEFEHLNELGDVARKKLIVELMGKYSNIIFCDEDGMIIDSIKHVPASLSSVREVLPGREYFIPKTSDKKNPVDTTMEEFINAVGAKPASLTKAIYLSYTGISPIAASEICYRARLDGERPFSALNQTEQLHLYHTFELFMEQVTEENNTPYIIYNKKEPMDYVCFSYEQFEDYDKKPMDGISATLEGFYAAKEAYTRMHQKSADLRRNVSTILERNRKKYDLQLKQLKDTEKREKFKVYGELLHTYGYNVEPGAKKLECINYYDNTPITIPLDETKTPMENAKHYFDKYNKQKRTKEALDELIQETYAEIQHLESVMTSIDIAVSYDDLVQIKEELMNEGYIKRHYKNNKKEKIKSKPFHYLSSAGYDIYVGKNNLQNEELTFKFANGGDWWFHAKKMPGSHVIVKTKGEELPDIVFEEAAKLAAFYSKGRGNDKVEIDYVLRKEVKKPNGSKPGFVVYYTNYSMITDSDISSLTLVKD
ncbi:MAG: NFACT family protein [Lachnospiraceae bacterium]|nr:NFACT family protein [Lachnospiraceae bacterium]